MTSKTDYKPPTVTLNEALSWLSLEELKGLKTACTQNMVDSLKSIKKPLITQNEAKEDRFFLDDKGQIVPMALYLRRSLYKMEVDEVMDHYKRLGRRINAFITDIEQPFPQKDTIGQLDIDKAREYPIEDLIDTPIRNGIALCPFHEEGTPSMSIRRHNRYYCFGCGAKGDAIDFYMKIHDVDFLTAVRKLSTGGP